MIRLNEQIIVNRDIDGTFDYVSDFTTIEQWDPGVVESRKLTPGKTGVGTQYLLTLRYGIFRVVMSYTIVEYQAPHKIVLQGKGTSFSVRDTIEFKSESPHQTKIVYQADLSFTGFSHRISPLFKGRLDRIGKQALAGLEKAFNRKISAPELSMARNMLDRSVIGGLPAFTRYGYTFSRRRWKPVVDSLHGKTVLITGATSGIGYAAARAMAHRGARLIFLARNPEKARRVIREISQTTGNPAMAFYPVDMESLGQIKRVAKDLLSRESHIDVLINNAGAMYPRRQVTRQGFEKTFAADLLGPFALTEMLLPLLTQAGKARIINVSSGGMYTQGIPVDDLQYVNGEYDGATAYARAKRGLVIVTELWAEKFARHHIGVHAMHPGWVKTPGLEQSLPGFYNALKSVMRTPEQGADTIVWLASAPEVDQSTGQFWLDRAPHTTHVFAHTRETPEQRAILYNLLTAMLIKERP
jgi:NAD(P)-dependent dehydrogenase (short-subunit alcohol dehydrogenase family)